MSVQVDVQPVAQVSPSMARVGEEVAMRWVHTKASSWCLLDEFGIAIDRDDRARAYVSVEAKVGEAFVVEWAPGPLGERRFTTSGGPVLWIDSGSHPGVERRLLYRLADEPRQL